MTEMDIITRLEAKLEKEPPGWPRVEMLRQLALELKDRDPLSGLKIANEAHSLAAGLKPSRKGERLALAGTLGLQAELNCRAGNNLEALYQSFEAVAMLEELGAPESQPALFQTLSSVYLNSGSFSEALSWAMRSLSAARKLGDSLSEAGAFLHIGAVHNHMKDFARERENYEEALSIFREHGRVESEAVALRNIGTVLLASGEFVESVKHASLAAELARRLGLAAVEAAGLTTMAEAYLREGLHEEGRKSAAEALELSARIGLKQIEMYATRLLGQNLDALGASDKARDRLFEALRLAEKLESMEGCALCHEALALSFKRTGNFEEALAHHEKFHSFQESLFNNETEGKLRTLRVLHEVDAANREAETLRREKSALEREVDRREKAEKALLNQTEALKKRNEELDSFAHTVAHDLKNPLTSIVTGSEFLERTWHDTADEVKLHLFKSMRASGTKLVSIIDELLLLAAVRGMNRVVMKPLDMGRVVDEALKWLDPLLKEKDATVLLPDRWPEAKGHAPWIEEVWVNFISNAAKYGGTSPRIELGFEALGKSATRFFVFNDGPAITDEEKARLFLPFERLHQVNVKGHGLGLSIVRRIIEKHGGTVGVDSPVSPGGAAEGLQGRGCRFYFTLSGPS